MSSLPWFRVARRFIGLGKQQELPYLEALMESEEGQPHNDYRIASRIAPPVCAVVGVFSSWLVLRAHELYFSVASITVLALSALLWFFFDRADRAIPASRQRLRRQANILWQRYRGIKNLIGIEPALSPAVGDILNHAAGIYLKHAKPINYFARPKETPITKSERAIEDAMARMLDLVIPETPAAQELELSKGWAVQLLKEMRALDAAIERQKQSPELSYDDPLINLREARMELEMREAANRELDQQA